MTDLTKPQLTFVGWGLLLDLVEDIEGAFGSTLGQLREECTDEELLARFAPEEVEALRLATDSLEKARTIMEEDAAFNHVLAQIVAAYPKLSDRQQQAVARAQLKEPGALERAVEDSRLYDRLMAGS